MVQIESDSELAPDARELQERLELARSELELLYRLDEQVAKESHGQSRLLRLIGELTRHLNMSYTVLLVPSKNIRISVTHGNWKQVDRRALDQHLLRVIFPQYAESTSPVLLQMPKLPKGALGSADSYQTIINTVRDRNNDPVGVLASFCQVDGLALAQSSERQVRYVTRFARRIIDESYDPLTGMMMRPDFVSIMDAALSQLDGDADSHCLIYIDLDKLQVVNDTFDQRAGDEILLRFSKLLRESLPGGASVARIGGDEFAALLRFRGADSGMRFAEEMRRKCQELVYLRGDKSFPVTFSAGVLPLTEDSVHESEPLVVARLACEKAKDHGGDRIECYDDSDKSIVRRVDNLQLFSQLQDAISQGTFLLDAQPIVPLNSAQDGGHFEILVRMHGQSGDVMLPEQFFSAAEQYQLMPKLDRMVLKKFFDTVQQADGQHGLGRASFAINLSGQSLSEPAFHEYVRQCVVNSNLAPGQLCFEITETAAIANREVAVRFMLSMRDLGCRFALDDFGAGLSSFAYLRDMPVDILKIDGSFVRDLDTNKVSESMVAAVAQVAKVMGLKTVAEFVETEAVREGLVRLGVDYGQGFLLGRPLPLERQLQTFVESPSDTIINLSDLVAVRT